MSCRGRGPQQETLPSLYAAGRGEIGAHRCDLNTIIFQLFGFGVRT